MPITPLPSVPQTSDGSALFTSKADIFLGALPQFVTEANALGVANTNYFRLVDVVSTTNKALSSALANGQTIDGVSLVTGMRVLLVGQTTGSENGIYDVPASGTASRSADSNTSGFMPPGMIIVVQRGTTYQSAIWLHTTAAGLTLGTTALTFTRKGGNPTRQVLTSGSAATYTTPAGVNQLRIRMVGGGGGGGGNSSSGASGSAGGTTTFNSINAVGGGGGNSSGSPAFGGTGGTGGTSPNTIRFQGNGSNTGITGANGGGTGGGSAFGAGAPNNNAAPANSGGGGGGAASASGNSGGGGGGGEYVEIIINSPSATYTYTIGAGGGAGGAGGAGGSGVIIVDEVF